MICVPEERLPTLRKYLDEHYVTAKAQRPGTILQKRISIALLERFAGHPLRVDEVTRPLLNAWIAHLEKSRAPSTAHAKRKDILALLRQAHEDEMIDAPPARIRKVSIPRDNPKAWTAEEVARIVAAAAVHRHSDVMVATIRLCWDTDCRISAVYAAPPSALCRERGCVMLYEPKMARIDCYPVTAATIDALDKLPTERARLCGATVVLRRLRSWLTEVLEDAGLEHDRRSKFHRIRRSKYTAVAAKFGIAAAAKHARHTSTAMARYYLDASLLPDLESVHSLALPE